MALGVAAVTACAPTPLRWDEVLALPAAEPTARVAYGTHPDQFGELYLPEGSGPFGVVVLVHGGCWHQDYGLDHLRPFAGTLQQRGWAVWSLEYRRLGGAGGWPATGNDVTAGTQHLAMLARQHSLDLERVVLVGHSAGGHLSLWLATQPAESASTSVVAQAVNIRAVVALAAITDLETYAGGTGACNQRARELVGGESQKRATPYRTLSPQARPAPTMPVYLVQGERDPIVPLEQAQRFAAHVRDQGGTAETVFLPNAGHFDVIALSGPHGSSVLSAIEQALGTARSE